MNSFPAKFHSVAVQPGILAAARNRSISRFCSTAVLAALSVVCFNTAKVGAQNLTCAPGDLLLYFMQFGGTQTVMVNLGPAWTYRDATANIMNLVNIGSTLMSAFPSSTGGAWYSDTFPGFLSSEEKPLTYWGLAGVRSSTDSNTFVFDGDPTRTVYVSRNRINSAPDGTAGSTAWFVPSNTSMTIASANILSQNNRMEVASTTPILVEPASSSLVDNSNTFLGDNLGTAYSTFPGGVVGGFGTGDYGMIGGVSAEGAVDRYRILATTSPSGIVENGTRREGQYQGTFVIDQAGVVSYIAPIPEPKAWILALVSGLATFALARRRHAHSKKSR